MITTKALRTGVVLVVLAIAALVATEVYWSMQAKSAAQRTARNAAFQAAHDLGVSHNSLHARATAEAETTHAGMHLDAFTLETNGFVKVTVSTHARSYLLRRIGPTRSVSEITVTASAAPQ